MVFASRSTRTRCTRSLLVAALSVATLVSLPALAQASTRSGGVLDGRGATTTKPVAHASGVCSKISAASVSALVGYKVPAGIESTFNLKPTAANFHISGVNTVCTYGGSTTMAALLKDVSLSFETVSKPLTSAELQQSLAKAEVGAKFKFVPYSGQGITGFYFSLTEAGITGQGISVEENSTHFSGASVESKTISKSTLVALAKLAEKI
jgi:hypothetical protein